MTMVESEHSNGVVQPARLTKSGQLTRRGKGRLINRASLDGRTAVAQAFDSLVASIHTDLGGRDQISSIEATLVESFAGATVVLDHINAKILTGAEIDSALVAMHAAAISAQVRCAAKLGTMRRAKPVNNMENFLAKRKRTATVPPSTEIITPEPELIK
jgi:hypothetical protein